MDNDIERTIEKLEEEEIIFSQLIYRNHNQHSKTDLFSYLKSLNRKIKYLPADHLRKFESRISASLRQQIGAKIAHSELLEMCRSHELCKSVVNISAECLIVAFQCADYLRKLLAKRIFAPLYTILFAVVSRLLSCFISITLYFNSQNDFICAHLKHIGATQARNSKLIREHLERTLYDNNASGMLERLKPTYCQAEDTIIIDKNEMSADYASLSSTTTPTAVDSYVNLDVRLPQNGLLDLFGGWSTKSNTTLSDTVVEVVAVDDTKICNDKDSIISMNKSTSFKSNSSLKRRKSTGDFLEGNNSNGSSSVKKVKKKRDAIDDIFG